MGFLRKILGNLALDFGLLLFLAALVAIFSLFGMQRVANDYQELVNHSFAIERLAARVEIDLLLAVEHEEAFLLMVERGNFEEAVEAHVVPHNELTKRLEEDIQQLRDLTNDNTVLGDEAIQEDLEKMETAVVQYEKDFSILLALLEERGTVDSGLEGSFRQRALMVEQLIDRHPEELQIKNVYLTLRLQEESYLVTHSFETAEMVNFWYHELVGLVEDSELPRREKSDIAYEMEFYDNEFLKVVEINDEIEDVQADLLLQVEEVMYLAEDIARISRETASVQMADARLVASQTIQLVTMSVVVIVVFGLGLAVAISFQLRRDPKQVVPTMAGD